MYKDSAFKTEVPIGWTKHLMTTHPVVFITTIGEVNGELIAGIAPFATCLDTSYEPPYLTFSAAIKQHSILGGPINTGEMNTLLNIRQFPYFVVNVPGYTLLKSMDIVAMPYDRKDYRDKIELAGLTKLQPFRLSKNLIYPPIIEECLAHLECEVVDIHRPQGSDHWNITGKVVGVSYDQKLGQGIDEIRLNLVNQNFHHFGSNTKNHSERYIASTSEVIRMPNALIFKLEEHKSKTSESFESLPVVAGDNGGSIQRLKTTALFNYILIYAVDTQRFTGRLFIRISDDFSYEKILETFQKEAWGFRVELRGIGKLLINGPERKVEVWEENDLLIGQNSNSRMVIPLLKYYLFQDYEVAWRSESKSLTNETKTRNQNHRFLQPATLAVFTGLSIQ